MPHSSLLINILKITDMKTTKFDLNDDFIGGQGSLTIDEEKALSDYFRQKKQPTKSSKIISHHRIVKHNKVIA